MDQPYYEVGQKPGDPSQAAAGGGYYEEPRKSRGCFFYGCITVLIIGVIGLLLCVAAFVTLGYFANRMINEYTDTAPAPIPQVNLPDDQRKEVIDRWQAFRKAVDEGREAEIVLTADEINALIEREPEFKGKVYVTIKDDQITAQISWPLTIPFKGQRYLNGSGTITAEMKDDKLDVRLKDLEVRGKHIPDDAKKQLAGQNLAEEYVKDPDNRAMIRKFRSIQIKDGKVYIKARSRDEDEKKEAEKAKAEGHEEDKAKEAEKVKADDHDQDKAKETEKAKADDQDKAKAEPAVKPDEIKGETPEPAKPAAPKPEAAEPAPKKAAA
jgi:hypothetical protein